METEKFELMLDEAQANAALEKECYMLIPL